MMRTFTILALTTFASPSLATDALMFDHKDEKKQPEVVLSQPPGKDVAKAPSILGKAIVEERKTPRTTDHSAVDDAGPADLTDEKFDDADALDGPDEKVSPEEK